MFASKYFLGWNENSQQQKNCKSKHSWVASARLYPRALEDETRGLPQVQGQPAYLPSEFQVNLDCSGRPRLKQQVTFTGLVLLCFRLSGERAVRSAECMFLYRMLY